MLISKSESTSPRAHLVPMALLLWYVLFFLAMAISPLDRKTWLAANILPCLFVGTLVLTYRDFPLSNIAYLAITGWLTLHTVAVHYTYPKVPFGFWLDQWFQFHRNHFDRIVHFSFGFLLAYPLEEAFQRLWKLKGWVVTYLVVMTILGYSALWEIFEAWVGQVAHPDLEMALVGHQGDVWDPQKDMAAAFYGALLCIALLAILRRFRDSSSALESGISSSQVGHTCE